MYRRLLIGLACVCLLAGGLTTHAQTARFSGQVTDQQKAAIQNADVWVVNQDSQVRVQTKTDASGSFTVPYLPAGHYRIEVEASGFQQVMSAAINLAVGQALIFNVQLTVGSAQSSVEVNSKTESTQINTENSEVSDTVTGTEVTGIQLNGRNFTQLIALAPGVSNQTQQDEARVGLRGSVSYSVNGGRTEYNAFLVDGSETLNVGLNKNNTSLVVTPSVDAIQEIKVLTSNYGAQYPSTGNGTTLVTTKSGADQLHGNAYEFLRNEALNARGYFDVTSGAPLYRRNDFGGTIGGPIMIPHLYDGHGKTHFFFSEEARIEKDPYAYRQAVPSLAERNGDFSDVCPFPSSGQVGLINKSKYRDCPTPDYSLPPSFPAYHLPVSRTATAILNTGIVPAPNAYSGCNQGANPTGSCYLSDVSLPTYYREELFRVDHALSDRTQFSFRYIHDEWDTTVPVPQYGYVTNSFPTIQNRVYGPGLSLAARVTEVFSSTLLNEFIASYVNQNLTFTNVPAAPYVDLKRPSILDAPTCAVSLNLAPDRQNNSGGSDCGIGHIFSNGYGSKLPGIIIGGNNAAYGGTGFSVDPGYTPWAHSNPVISFADNVTKTWRSHTLSFGGQFVIFRRNQLNGPIGAATGDTQGLITFSNQQSYFTSGNAFADFLGMGAIANYQQDSGQARYHQHYQIFEPYFQDDWKVTPRLTVNIGLRVSMFGTYKEAGKNAYNWEPNAYSRAAAESVTFDRGNSRPGTGLPSIPSSGELLDASTGKPIPIYQANGQPDPRLTNGIVRCGVNGIPDGCMKGHLWNPSPRVGFAWDPTGTGKTSIRAGYGVFFEHGTADEANSGSLEASAPTVLSLTQLNPYGLGCIGNVAQGCPIAPGAFPLNVTEIPTRAVWPYVQQWSLSVQREIPGKMLATFGYVGSKGTHLTVEREKNQLIPTPAGSNPYGKGVPLLTNDCSPGNYGMTGKTGFDGAFFHLTNGNVVGAQDPSFVNLLTACNGYGQSTDPNSLREYARGIGQIYSLENIANSAYNAFQTTVRRVSAPLYLGIAYTYSHSLDSASDRSDTTFVNSYNVRGNRASSNFDQRHLLHISAIYDLPLRRPLQSLFSNIEGDPNLDDQSVNQPPSAFLNSTVAKTVLDGWQLSTVTLFETGIPFTVVNIGSINGVGVPDNAGVYNGVGSGSYPDRVKGAKSTPPTAGNNALSVGPLLLNPGMFAAPQGLTFGNAGRNSLNNPRRWNFDTSLLKHFHPSEKIDLEFRAEAFNVFNHTQFRIYDPTLGTQSNNTVNCYADPSAEGTGTSGTFSAAGDAATDCLTGSSFLHPVDAHRPRTIQFGLKLAF